MNSIVNTLRGALSYLFLGLNTIFWAVIIVPLSVLKLLMPAGALRDTLDRFLNACALNWCGGNNAWVALTQRVQWDVQGTDGLDERGWYLVTSNHQSWTDIVVLQKIFHRKIPFLKFFLKQQLIYVPVIGLAWWGLDFPFMRRHSKEFLAKHPEQRGKDTAATKAACAKFSRIPTSVMNFVEGTRFTAAKHARQVSDGGSELVHLLKPKATGMALAIEALGEKFSSLLSVSIVYPEGVPSFWGYWSGQMRRVIVRVHRIEIPARFMQGDYEGDAALRRDFQLWLNDLWAAKDRELAALKAVA
ncbi:acyltransferase [Piscinibacterium candidicorallinum]|jgi:1-acyl-sn-glycerol-3-phosphate acyltransferase|uniref:Acyltransferase n=1 Tax=Piscinibacterium candidicorallinum TaxID=1793872 RepID=A0ABV7H391_9BURK